MRILIVEDSPLVQNMYGLAFSRREHELTTASDGRAALAELADPASQAPIFNSDGRS
jgi:DNA-binding response OmpR family regulator